MPDGRGSDTAVPEDRLLELHFPARADRMKLVRPGVLAAARMCGFDQADAEALVLAVAEACQNVILHAYRDQEPGELRLGLYRQPDGILVRLRDFAAPVDPSTIRPRDLDDLRPGGLGTHFIREIMDAVSFAPAADGHGNLLEMTKRRDGAT